MVGWMNFHSRSRRDEEQPLLESAISPATHPHHDHGAVGLAISALAILLGGCIASLCGLGGTSQPIAIQLQCVHVLSLLKLEAYLPCKGTAQGRFKSCSKSKR